MDKHRNVSRIIGIVLQSKGGYWERSVRILVCTKFALCYGIQLEEEEEQAISVDLVILIQE